MKWKTDISEGKVLCLTCEELHDVGAETCVRCGAGIFQRKPSSMAQTFGYVIAATLFLIPANLMPMMVVTSLGTDEGSTIMEGVIYFLAHKEYGLGLIIFIASVAVPVFKLSVVYFLLMIVAFRQKDKAKLGLKLFHLIHLIGKWSMLDVFVVALMVSMVQFQGLATIQTGAAAISFCAAVIFTIIATEKFDPRLMFDN
ncbi:Paraquat-inducible protein A [Lentisphaera araneosa HTCC2155]|jgi:paraquat-inducible protein A|uniref:Paraquat-inducible protein A n=1 Tax=Lentisphaera araneosa HTCC2155 TaxID=313628 RepID=A6DM97_9BACT|nr:paraquat-inducible protein A [Lentisphaera araneosa]EDM27087.1 Paraquat-inducible protein A [Lentisphaera araneosa HTCC2155]